MKIILDHFKYKGQYFEHFECELPQVKKLEDIPEGRLTEYICESLDQFIEEGTQA